MNDHILLVDDDPTHLKLVCQVLEFEGHGILTAIDAEQAQVVLADTLPDLILMDIALPGMDGLTLTRKLKADGRTRHIKIVAVTASAMKGDDQKAFDAGCEGYITKPIDTRTLPGELTEILARGRGANVEHRASYAKFLLGCSCRYTCKVQCSGECGCAICAQWHADSLKHRIPDNWRGPSR